MSHNTPFDPRHQPDSTSAKIVVALERISEAFRVLLWNESKTHGLSPIQVQLLIFLQHHGSEYRTVSYLASEFNMTKATISDAVKTLEKKELITKKFSAVDSRSFTIELTANGEKIARQTAHFAQEIMAPLDRLDQDEQSKLLIHLFGIIRHLNQSGVITLERMCFSCVHYRNNHKGSEHFCKLLETPLKQQELRLDCPEHQKAAV